MKRIAIISDIHGNLHALDAVVTDAMNKGFDEMWCLGDTVGYGAYPSECIEIVRNRCNIVLAGNHDLAACRALSLDEFNLEARLAVEWTSDKLSNSEISFLRSLEPLKFVEVEGIHFVLAHGSPMNPIWEYVVGPFELQRTFYFLEDKEAQGAFVGHSHIQFFSSSKDLQFEMKRPSEKLVFEEDTIYILNPGSVGQPRDYDPRAAYMIIEVEDRSVNAEFYRVKYDIEEASSSIIEAGLPLFLATRLRLGY
ncbi:MAG: metallophosphoesterase family protein [Actinobacteria bacterium]|nr:metallophosphoesterase family protein [Actinomycetota bacterium]